jgi:serine/threonine-protein kinase RsbW
VAEERSIRIDAQLEAVAQLAQVVREEGEAAALSPDAVIEIELAVVEAANNIVAHGYSVPGGAIEMRVVRQDGLRVELADCGTTIPANLFDNPPAADLDAERGRGLAIIRACVDRLSYSQKDGVNRLILVKGTG